eukprot:COSAG02_NODE_53961_length_298_cov_2.316583_1_plen_53_part_01
MAAGEAGAWQRAGGTEVGEAVLIGKWIVAGATLPATITGRWSRRPSPRISKLR